MLDGACIVLQIGLTADAVNKTGCGTDEFGDYSCGQQQTNAGELEAATVIGILGFTAGIIMIAQKSHNDVTFVPLGVGSLHVPTLGGSREGAVGSAPQGGALQVRF